MAAEGALRLTPATIGSVTGLPARTGPPNAPSSGRFIRIHPMKALGLRPCSGTWTHEVLCQSDCCLLGSRRQATHDILQDRSRPLLRLPDPLGQLYKKLHQVDGDFLHVRQVLQCVREANRQGRQKCVRPLQGPPLLQHGVCSLGLGAVPQRQGCLWQGTRGTGRSPADTDLAESLAALSLPASQAGQDLPAVGMAAFTPNRRSPESRDD